MEARYHKFMKLGKKEAASEFLLSDFDDQSEYQSAQGYGDNSLCLCQESTFTFLEKVIDEVVAIYKEAKVELTTIHSGGDEVGYGSWQKSPVCKAFIAANSESISHTDDLQSHFTRRFITHYGKTRPCHRRLGRICH